MDGSMLTVILHTFVWNNSHFGILLVYGKSEPKVESVESGIEFTMGVAMFPKIIGLPSSCKSVLPLTVSFGKKVYFGIQYYRAETPRVLSFVSFLCSIIFEIGSVINVCFIYLQS